MAFDRFTIHDQQGASARLLLVVSGVLGLGLLVIRQFKAYNAKPLPPGPKGRPFVGVLFDLPKHHAFLKLTEWAREYGPIMHLQIGRQHTILCNDPQVARDLLDKRSKIYSDRPPSVVGEIVSEGRRSVLMPYNARWRGVRKLFASLMTPAKCDTIYNRWGEREAVITCMDILHHPEDLKRNLNRFALSVVRSMTYGKRAVRRDPLMMEFETAAQNFITAFRPGAFMIEYFPWLLRLPRPLQPGMKRLMEYHDLEKEYNMEKYYETVKDHEKHPERHNIITQIQSMHNDPGIAAEMSEVQRAATAMEITGVGTDTTAASVMILINALLEYPECLKKAHEELDRVIGQDRYPGWHEQDQLPYMRALIKEQQRWRSISPLSMAHYTYTEDEYNGYRIPKNTVVRLNTWAIHYDPARFPNPHIFDPERYINHTLSAAASANASDVRNRDHWSYGSGKRICPGLHLAERNIWNLATRIIHTFDITPKMGADGQPQIPKLEDYHFGLVLLPPDFEANFTIRSEKLKNLLEREFVDLAKEGKLSSWDELPEEPEA